MRKTSSDYRKELLELQKKTESVESHIKDKLLTMSERFPDAIIKTTNNYEIKAKSVTKAWVNFVTTEELLDTIHAIEMYNADKERIVQMTIYDS